MDDDHFGLIPRPDGQLVGKPLDQLPAIRRVTSEVLAHVQRLPVEKKRVRIAGFELCAPDAELITVWASAVQVSPDDLLTHLTKTSLNADYGYLLGFDAEVVDFEILDGELRSVVWDLDRFPCFPDLWVSGLKLQKFAVWASKGVNAELTLTPNAPDLTELWVLGLPGVDFPRSKESSLLKSLSLSGLPRLRRLTCVDFVIAGLDLSAAKDLQKIEFCNNQLTVLDLSAVHDLTELRCRDNQLAALDLSAVPDLQRLDCRANQLVELDLSSVTGLLELNCGKNRLTALDLSPIADLEKLSCGGNQITKIDLASLSCLKVLWCPHNQLVELDLSSVPGLETLECGVNPLIDLDLSPVPNLRSLSCGANQLTELDLSAVSRLRDLNCQTNEITELDLSPLPHLHELNCSDNKITALDLPAALTVLCCDRAVVLHNEPQRLSVIRR